MATEVWHLRVEEDDRKAFSERCKAIDVEPNDMCREIIKAFADNRVRIIPTTGQITKGEMYVSGE